MTVARGLDGSERCIGVNVTGAGAIPQLRNGVLHRRSAAVLGVRIAAIAIGMTTRTGRSIGRVGPGRRIGIGSVTTDASEVETGGVIAGIFGRGMFEVDWRPRHGGVTDIAIARSGHVAH